MKKLLFQLDTDIHPAVFDTVVEYHRDTEHLIAVTYTHLTQTTQA